MQPGFFAEEKIWRETTGKKGEILNKCGNLEIRIAENNNRRSHRVISGISTHNGQ